MRLPLLACLSLPLLALADSPALTKLKSLSTRHSTGIIRFNSELYDEFVSTRSRDYSLSVLLTALEPQYACTPCRRFKPEYEVVARSWKAQSKSSKGGRDHFFAVLDFDGGQEIFKRQSISTVPLLYYHVPTEGPGAGSPTSPALMHDFNRNGLDAESYGRFLNAQGIRIQISRPVDYARIALLAFTLLGAGVLIRIGWKYVQLVIQNRYVWGFIVTAFILIMTSGHMWCQIRTPPYFMPTREGTVNLIAGGYSNQFGVETHIVASLYGILAFAVYTLTETLPTLGKDGLRQRVGIYVWTGVWIIMMGALMSVFRIKNPGYPFRLVF